MLFLRSRTIGRHILDDVGDRIARDGKHVGREGDTVRIGREHAVIVQRVVARKPGVGQLLTGAATHALQDHRTEHLPMPHFFGAQRSIGNVPMYQIRGQA